jgi:hypothetical protein
MNRLKMPAWLLAGGLILLQMILIAIIVHGESLTFDEGDHIFAGYMMWHSGDYGLNPEHPPLVKLVATLPLLQEKLWVPPLQQRMFKGEAYRDGRDFMERNDGPKHRLLFRMRLAAGCLCRGPLGDGVSDGEQALWRVRWFAGFAIGGLRAKCVGQQ